MKPVRHPVQVDRRLFAFVQAHCRLDVARAAKLDADAEYQAASTGLLRAFADLTKSEQSRVNIAYAEERSR